MTKLTIDLPEDMAKEVGIFKERKRLSSKEKAVIEIITRYFRDQEDL